MGGIGAGGDENMRDQVKDEWKGRVLEEMTAKGEQFGIR